MLFTEEPLTNSELLKKTKDRNVLGLPDCSFDEKAPTDCRVHSICIEELAQRSHTPLREAISATSFSGHIRFLLKTKHLNNSLSEESNFLCVNSLQQHPVIDRTSPKKIPFVT